MEILKNNKIIKKRIFLFLLFLLSATIFLLLFSWTTSPLFDYKSTDSAIFQTFGKFSNRGLAFYKDLFDHKGPIMFLLQKIGFMIIDGKVGVFIIQVCFWTLTLCGTYKIIRMFFETKIAVVLTEVSQLCYILFYLGLGGNDSAEYILPFLTFSLYFTILFIKKAKIEGVYEHNPVFSLFYGISFAFGAFTRLTNSLPICITVLVITCVLVYKKKWKNIFKNAALLAVGVLIVTVPIFIWFIFHGSFHEMIDATFIANIKYSETHRYSYTVVSLIKFYARYRMIIIVGLILGVIGIANKKYRLLSIVASSNMLGSIIIDLTTPMFYYYALIWTPTVIMIFCASYFYVKGKIITRILLVCTLVFLSINGVKAAKDCYLAKQDTRLKTLREDALAMKREIPKKSYSKVFAYETSACFYLETDIPPCYRHFVLQDFHSSFSKSTQKQMKKDIHSLKADYIIEENNNKNRKWDKFINKHYHIIKTNKWFVLKKKNGL